MEYLRFVVEVEQGPRKWRAKILRSSGKPLVTGRRRIWQFVTGVEATTAPAALLVALDAMDAGTFSCAAPLPEKFWRRRGRRAKALALDDHAVPSAQCAQDSVKQKRSHK
jgi:hypothetical protein